MAIFINGYIEIDVKTGLVPALKSKKNTQKSLFKKTMNEQFYLMKFMNISY